MTLPSAISAVKPDYGPASHSQSIRTCSATMPLPGLCRGDQTEVAQDPQNAGGGGTHSVQDAA